ncbi:MAG: tRNA pseudouridine(55) synthase TruB [Planctomycetota bacterium]
MSGPASGAQEKLCGVLVVDKPLGWSSMHVCRVVRRAVQRGRGRHKVGHAGTLDPLATGVVVVCIGKATKQVNRLMDQAKVYKTTIDLSAFTATDDAELEDEREEVAVEVPPTRQEIEQALGGMTGTVMQTPPAYSAIHVQGRRAYQAARAGESVELQPRPVRIDAMQVLAYTWPTLGLRITCGKGTYIRSIARDLGKALGTGGYLTALRRTASGRLNVAMATPVERFEGRLEQRDLMVFGEQEL